MPNVTITKIIDSVFQLVAEANLSIGFMEGTGLGAILLTIIAVALIRSRAFMRSKLSDLIQAWWRKPQPPAE